MPKIRDLIEAINTKYPLARAESWDKVGLQIGDVAAPATHVLVAHEVTPATLAAAAGHEALVVYHPLLFRPLENLDFSNHTARLAGRCLAAGLHVIAVHTALDNAPQPYALGDSLAQSLGLHNIEVLQASGREALFKLVVFTPPEALHEVSLTLWDAGAGRIGFYDQCSFRTRGAGTFRPLPGADPYTGEVGQREEADEWRLEVLVPAARRDAMIAAMIAAHPYEEVAYDLYPLHNTSDAYGAARVGQVAENPVALDDFARIVQQELGAPSVRVVRAGDAANGGVNKVACVPGSGASYIEAAARAGCDCLVTGDIKHHDALKAQAWGLSLIDATHTATERAAVALIAEALSLVPDVTVVRCPIDTNPFAAL
ncbi:MAG: Nif3-like dinuclear metal center hexameric protein [Armatimonadota bacterium]|nr:Nif3-like dinuclear metal center hexameric protein [Armatimonadota bacterium]